MVSDTAFLGEEKAHAQVMSMGKRMVFSENKR